MTPKNIREKIFDASTLSWLTGSSPIEIQILTSDCPAGRAVALVRFKKFSFLDAVKVRAVVLLARMGVQFEHAAELVGDFHDYRTLEQLIQPGLCEGWYDLERLRGVRIEINIKEIVEEVISNLKRLERKGL